MTTYHSAPWLSRVLYSCIDIAVTLLSFVILYPNEDFLKINSIVRNLYLLYPIFYFLYKLICMSFFSRTLGMWFLGLSYFEVDDEGNLIEESAILGISLNKTLRRIVLGFFYNLLFGIPYLEILFSSDGLHSLDRKSKVFIIGKVFE